jgi:hypothetical protein
MGKYKNGKTGSGKTGSELFFSLLYLTSKRFLMLKKILVLGILLGFLASASAQTESITFTTYYPSPYGVYKNLRIYPSSGTGLGGACSNEGEMYYDQTTHNLYICSGTPSAATLTWTAVGGAAGSSLWTNTGSNLYPNDSTWKVGIGTASPQNRLDVEGGAVIGATYSGTNTAPNNGLLVQGNVGIGTAAPAVELHVRSIGAASPGDIAIQPTTPRLWTMSVTDDGRWELHYLTTGTSYNGVNTYVPVRVYAEGGGQENTLVVRGGNVGIRTANPQSTLQVAGGVQVGTDAAACSSAAKAGTLRYNTATSKVEYCNGAQWKDLATPTTTYGVCVDAPDAHHPATCTCDPGTLVSYNTAPCSVTPDTRPCSSNCWYGTSLGACGSCCVCLP